MVPSATIGRPAGDQRGGRRRDDVALAVHRGGRATSSTADRRERAAADVQRQRRERDAARGERARAIAGRHVEPGGRRRDRAGRAREHRLVALAIAGAIASRARCRAAAGRGRCASRNANASPGTATTTEPSRRRARSTARPRVVGDRPARAGPARSGRRARARRATRSSRPAPAVAGSGSRNSSSTLPPVVLLAEHARGDHARVVRDHHRVRRQQLDDARGTGDPRARRRRRRGAGASASRTAVGLLRDQLGRELEGVVGRRNTTARHASTRRNPRRSRGVCAKVPTMRRAAFAAILVVCRPRAGRPTRSPRSGPRWRRPGRARLGRRATCSRLSTPPRSTWATSRGRRARASTPRSSTGRRPWWSSSRPPSRASPACSSCTPARGSG